jgi:hypothetical protein
VLLHLIDKEGREAVSFKNQYWGEKFMLSKVTKKEAGIDNLPLFL